MGDSLFFDAAVSSILLNPNCRNVIGVGQDTLISGAPQLFFACLAVYEWVHVARTYVFDDPIVAPEDRTAETHILQHGKACRFIAAQMRNGIFFSYATTKYNCDLQGGSARTPATLAIKGPWPFCVIKMFALFKSR